MAKKDPLHLRLRVFLIVFIGVMALGTLGFVATERMSLGDAFYFSVVTVATVGYGDLHPATQAGKILAMLLIVLGAGTFLGVIANATEIMLNRREKQARLKKLNMVIGVFFSEVGRKLLTVLSDHDPHLEDIRKELVVTNGWTDQDFKRAGKGLRHYRYGIQIENVDLEALRSFLQEKRDFLVAVSYTHLRAHET